MKPWGRFATFALTAVALLAGQLAALFALTYWFDQTIGQLPNFNGDGAAIAVIIGVSTPVEVALLFLFARRAAASAAEYLGLIWPRRSEVTFGVAAIVGLMIIGDAVSWLLGRSFVTSFQTDIYTTASAGGWLLWLWLAIVVATPIGEEIIFRGFLFRGWLKSPRDVWPVIVATALLWAIIHLQYDWYVVGQIFVAGVFLGWIRWVTGSTILTILLHALVNTEGMIETFVDLRWLS
ncbi:MAG TPA: CPBP family intramembrane glutamic endopeptidase [Pseudolabrys sp.]|nr:CPBP family intramembrane glutamic endopeptidase [Pseudolabrys sp.]